MLNKILSKTGKDNKAVENVLVSNEQTGMVSEEFTLKLVALVKGDKYK